MLNLSYYVVLHNCINSSTFNATVVFYHGHYSLKKPGLFSHTGGKPQCLKPASEAEIALPNSGLDFLQPALVCDCYSAANSSASPSWRRSSSARSASAYAWETSSCTLAAACSSSGASFTLR